MAFYWISTYFLFHIFLPCWVHWREEQPMPVLIHFSSQPHCQPVVFCFIYCQLFRPFSEGRKHIIFQSACEMRGWDCTPFTNQDTKGSEITVMKEKKTIDTLSHTGAGFECSEQSCCDWARSWQELRCFHSLCEPVPAEGEPLALAEDFQALMTDVSLAPVGPFLHLERCFSLLWAHTPLSL